MKVGGILCILLPLMLIMPTTSGIGEQNNQIVISIEGGFGITITITNASGGPLPGTEWSVELKGIIFSGASSSGVIDPFANETTIKLFPVGIGPGIMTISVGNESSSVAFFMIGPFVFLL